MLDLQSGGLETLASSFTEFEHLAGSEESQQRWFYREAATKLTSEGMRPTRQQCFGYKIPLCFRESETVTPNVYVASLKEYVAFLGDLHRQLKNLPDGSKAKLVVTE